MIFLKVIKILMAVSSIIFLFINFKVALVLFIIGTIFHVVPLGPNALLSVITGYLMIFGLIYLFLDWQIGLILIILSFIVAKFRIYGNKVNNEYYSKNKK